MQLNTEHVINVIKYRKVVICNMFTVLFFLYIPVADKRSTVCFFFIFINDLITMDCHFSCHLGYLLYLDTTQLMILKALRRQKKNPTNERLKKHVN